MLKSEMQHQFWITKKTVQRKLGSKEDEHIISSDAELDARIEVFKSVSVTSMELSKIIEQYQERLYILSQEESFFGRFLKEAGKRSKTTGQTITNSGKAVSYCGQQRMCVRVPLLRLQHEVDVFRYRAITDTQSTIMAMEKERTEYRAALEWMKSASSELDPDTGRGLEKFRTAQSHVRNAKHNFDSLSMDSIQKIDLLAAARCNMFSHVLVTYMTELKNFAQKTNSTFEAVSKSLDQKPKYDFCVLKELTQQERNQENVIGRDISSLDKDQFLFFADDFVDKNELNEGSNKGYGSIAGKLSQDNLVELYISDNSSIMNLYNQNRSESLINASNDITIEESVNIFSKVLDTNALLTSDHPLLPQIQDCKHNLNINNEKESGEKETLSSFQFPTTEGKESIKNLKSNHWIELFADLDPLANLEAFDLKISGNNKNFQQT